jgi:hypothetical protein
MRWVGIVRKRPNPTPKNPKKHLFLPKNEWVSAEMADFFTYFKPLLKRFFPKKVGGFAPNSPPVWLYQYHDCCKDERLNVQDCCFENGKKNELEKFIIFTVVFRFINIMIESFDIDSITSYMKTSIPVTSSVINPDYKELDRQHKSILSLLDKNKKKYAEISLVDKEMSEKEMERFMKKKSDKKTEIEDLEKQKTEIIQKKKNTKKHILFSDLDENQKFDSSINERKYFLDIIKVIAWRAETAMANIIKKLMSAPERARSLIRKMYSTDADIETDHLNNTLTVKIHNTNHWADDKILQNLCDNLNETKTVFPATNLIIHYKLVTS